MPAITFPRSPHALVVAPPPDPVQVLPGVVQRVLDQVRVELVSALVWQCAAGWFIPTRTLSDEMWFLIIAGNGWMCLRGQRYTLTPGTLAHWPAGAPHAAGHDPDRPFNVIACHYTAHLAGGLRAGALVEPPPAVTLATHDPVRSWLEAAVTDHVHRPPGWKRRGDALATAVFHQILRHVGDQAVVHPAGDAGALVRVLPALERMESDLARPCGIPALARLCDLSPAQFRRFFGKALGTTPVAHVRQLRLAAARRLLRETDGDLAAIARAVGFAEAAFFSHVFKRETGTSPGAWRRMPAGP